MHQVESPQVQLIKPVRDADSPVSGTLTGVSIVIPIGPGEGSWRSLLADFAGVDCSLEILLVGVDPEPSDFGQLTDQWKLKGRVEWIMTSAGRARQMNVGARHSRRDYLWFLHADSRLGSNAVAALERSLLAHPDALHYFELKYQNDGPSLTRWNAWGAQIRSQYFGLPFGDQGLCLHRNTFDRMDGFDEEAPFGEDHLLVWAAHRQRVALHSVCASISTSARKYRAHGWLPVTLNHGWLTCRQALPQLCKLLWSRFR